MELKPFPKFLAAGTPSQRPEKSPHNPFASARAHLDRARKHIRDLEAAENSIRPEKTFFDVVDLDPKTGDGVHKFCSFFVPWEASAILWDAVNNLRDALDHAYGAALEASGKSVKKNQFPFAESAAQLEKSLSGLPAALAEVVRKAKPFKSSGSTEGNDALWAIGTLSQAYKPGVASALATAVASLNGFSRLELPNGGTLTQPPIWDADKSELEFARAPQGSIVRHKFNLKVEIGFGDAGFLRSKPAVSTLNELSEQISAVCTGLEQAAQQATAAAA